MLSSHRKAPEFLDSIMILLNCSATYSILPYVIFHQYSRGIFVILIGIINIAYLFWKYGKATELPNNKLFYLYCVILLWNGYAGLFSNSGFIVSIAYLFSNFGFFILLYNLYISYRGIYTQKKSIWLIIRGYIWLTILCVLSVLAVFLLVKIGMDPHVNDIGSRYDLFEDNINTLGHEYYAPYHLGIVLDSGLNIKIPFFSEKGTICGIYHEPHVLTFLVFPCLFMMWAYSQKIYLKILIFLVGLFIMLIAASTTNILISLVCVMIALIFSKQGKIPLISLAIILLIVIFIIGLENTDLFFIAYKLEDGGGSASYTTNALRFAFTPKTLVGSNILSTSFLQDIGESTRDAGFITIVMNIIFLAGMYFKLVKMLFSSRFNCLMGIGVLYFMLHSIKTNMTTYTASVLVLCIFLVSYMLNSSSMNKLIYTHGENQKDTVK